MRQRIVLASVTPIALAVTMGLAHASLVSQDLFDEFGPNWRDAWMMRPLAPRPTLYEVVSDRGNPALRATSYGGASALFRRLSIEQPEDLSLSWRWRVDRGVENEKERSKEGDDYAARVLVTFGENPFDRGSRILSYVWASSEPVGSVYPSPRSDSVATIVVESGGKAPGSWVNESRDVSADYRAAFGEEPERVSAVALVVDTDDTQSSAVAWFDDIRVRHGP